MGEKWRKFKVRIKEDRQLRQKFYMGFLLVVVCCLFIGVLAKYIYDKATETSQITADKFYFTADLLGDTKMVSNGGSEETTYSFGEKSTEGTWYLYGASKHSIEIQIQNYFDELRITKQDIAYKGSITVQDEDGNVSAADAEHVKLMNGSQTFASGTLKTGDEEQSQKLTLEIPSHTDWQYANGTTVIVKIKSTSPYKKTLTMKFILYATDTNLKYRITDSSGSPYAELILMTNVEGTDGVKPYLVWSQELEIDNTNPLTFSYTNGAFTQQSGMTARNMQISESLKAGRSETIYFFKNDTSKNYAKTDTMVNPQNGKYTINIQ